MRLPDAAIEPIEWNALKGWSADDHVAALATFLASCHPLLRTGLREADKRPMYAALVEVCSEIRVCQVHVGHPGVAIARAFAAPHP